MKVGCRYPMIADEASRARGDQIVAWLRNYGEKRVNARMIDERRTIPPYVANDLGNQGIFGVQVETQYGGSALRTREVGRILEQAAAIDLALGTWILVCLHPGVRPIATFAQPALKQEVLPQLAAGRLYAGFGQTEPGAGTNFAGMAARAVAQPGGGWLLSGDKIWIGNSSWAGIVTVIAQEVDTAGKRRGLIGLAVRPDQPGVTIGRELLSMGMRGMVQGELHFRDVRVAPEALLGEREKGLEVGVDSMSWSRFSITSTSLGATKRAAQLMLRFATRRQIALRVYLPSMLPVLLEGFRLAVIFGFTAVLLAEMYASSTGIGHQIASWGENFQMHRLYAGVLLLAVIAVAVNEAIRAVEVRCSHWRS